MKLVHNNSMVAHLWANQTQSEARNGNGTFWFEGNKLYSYRTLIAQLFDGFALVSSNNMTQTTAAQLYDVRRSLQGNKRTIYSNQFSRGKKYQTISIETIIKEKQDTIKQAINELPNKRTLNTLLQVINTIESAVSDLQFLGADIPNIDLTVWDDKVKEYKDKMIAANNKKESTKRAKEQAQFAAWLAGKQVPFPRSYDRFEGSDLITVRDGIVITSRGAQAPLSDVLKAIEFYQLKQWPYETNGHKIKLGSFTLDSIDTMGNVKAGCHTFKAQEISRFIKEWMK